MLAAHFPIVHGADDNFILIHAPSIDQHVCQVSGIEASIKVARYKMTRKPFETKNQERSTSRFWQLWSNCNDAGLSIFPLSAIPIVQGVMLLCSKISISQVYGWCSSLFFSHNSVFSDNSLKIFKISNFSVSIAASNSLARILVDGNYNDKMTNIFGFF